MIKKLSEVHPYLYHYTTAAGLKGIIESQGIWATHISYLNDSEEHTGFFNRRLPLLIKKVVSGNQNIQNPEETINLLAQAICGFTVKFNNPYIASFCSLSNHVCPDDGLLSQWRGYGVDGGYAIVFDTKQLEQLLDEESKKFYFQFGTFCEVDYYHDPDHEATLLESKRYESVIQNAIERFLMTQGREDIDEAYIPMTALSVSYKHKGFMEESEVRIAAVLPNDDVHEQSKKTGDLRPVKPVRFREQNGLLVPYITLFGRQPNEIANKLPIEKIIIGPHPEQLKRQESVGLMLKRHGISVKVIKSDIPYLGR